MAEIQRQMILAVDRVTGSIVPLAQAEVKLPVIEQLGLRDRRPPKSLPTIASRNLNGMYFEAYQVPETHLTAILRSGGDWRWRFCTADGRVEVTSGSYPTKSACISAIDILRGGARDADLLVADKS